MSDCIDAPNRDRRETNPTVRFTVLNPEALLTPEVARAVVSLLLSPNRDPQPAGPVSTPDRKEAGS
jgi:hypothetical protein